MDPKEKVLVFQHDPFEDLGFFTEVFEKEKTSFQIVRLFHGEVPTEDWDRVRALLVLGGPMSAREEERFPFLHWEKTIIRAAIDDDLPVLGIGLGAQLIALALGAEVYRGSVKEIGWYPVSLNTHGLVDSLLGHLPEKPVVFGWHGDGFHLPAGGLRLASSVYFENQAFRVGKSIYGIQFHLEVTPEMIDRWLNRRAKELAQIPYVLPDKIRADSHNYSSTLQYCGERVLSEFIRRLDRFGRRKYEEIQAKL